MKANVEMVGGKSRSMFQFDDSRYVYTPMTADEKNYYCPERINLDLCWRMEVIKDNKGK